MSCTNVEMKFTEYNDRYPEYTKSEALILEALLKKHGYLHEVDGKSSFHMGSTSIVGMPGKPIIDITLTTRGLLPDVPQEFIDTMKKRNYIYWGAAPHMMSKAHDQWFYEKLPEGSKADHSFVIHFIDGTHDASVSGMRDFLDYRDYCNSDRSAFKKYRDAKIGATEKTVDGKKTKATWMEYQIGKSAVIEEIKASSKVWADKQRNEQKNK